MAGPVGGTTCDSSAAASAVTLEDAELSEGYRCGNDWNSTDGFEGQQVPSITGDNQVSVTGQRRRNHMVVIRIVWNYSRNLCRRDNVCNRLNISHDRCGGQTTPVQSGSELWSGEDCL